MFADRMTYAIPAKVSYKRKLRFHYFNYDDRVDQILEYQCDRGISRSYHQ